MDLRDFTRVNVYNFCGPHYGDYHTKLPTYCLILPSDTLQRARNKKEDVVNSTDGQRRLHNPKMCVHPFAIPPHTHSSLTLEICTEHIFHHPFSTPAHTRTCHAGHNARSDSYSIPPRKQSLYRALREAKMHRKWAATGRERTSCVTRHFFDTNLLLTLTFP